MRNTPKQLVAAQLRAAGFDIEEEDIHVVRGPKSKSDIIQCWSACCDTVMKRRVELTSAYTLTQLAKGLSVVPNTDVTCMYGDYAVVPQK